MFMLALDLDMKMEPLTTEDLKRLMDITNIGNIQNVITNELVNQYAQLLYNDIESRYEDIRYMAVRLAGERKKTLEERITISNADIKNVEKKIEETKKNLEDILQCQKQLDAALRSVDKSTKKRLDVIVSKLV